MASLSQASRGRIGQLHAESPSGNPVRPQKQQELWLRPTSFRYRTQGPIKLFSRPALSSGSADNINLQLHNHAACCIHAVSCELVATAGLALSTPCRVATMSDVRCILRNVYQLWGKLCTATRYPKIKAMAPPYQQNVPGQQASQIGLLDTARHV